MRFDVMTLFPEMFEPLKHSIIERASKANLIHINLVNIRDFSKDKHKKVDDTPYGGGAGMAFMGMGMNAAGGMMGAMQQPNNPSVYQQSFGAQGQAAPAEDPTEKLLNAKKLLDAGAITQEEFDKIKAQTLGL